MQALRDEGAFEFLRPPEVGVMAKVAEAGVVEAAAGACGGGKGGALAFGAALLLQAQLLESQTALQSAVNDGGEEAAACAAIPRRMPSLVWIARVSGEHMTASAARSAAASAPPASRFARSASACARPVALRWYTCIPGPRVARRVLHEGCGVADHHRRRRGEELALRRVRLRLGKVLFT